ncbi:MAG: hypothetical protein MUF64_02170 [Polyangiaceae bacterium]|nr:hypothetical protein [Polyangiaceae bacterium]
MTEPTSPPAPSPDLPSRPLRFVVLLDGLTVPRWQQRLIELLRATPGAELVAVVVNTPPEAPRRTLRGRIEGGLPVAGYALFSKLDAARNLRRCANMEPVLLRDEIEGVPRLQELPRRTQFSDYFSDATLEELRKLEPDYLLRLGFRILRGPVLSCASRGVLSFHHGDPAENRGMPSGFYEVLEGWGRAGVVLQVLSEALDGGEFLLQHSITPDPASVLRTRDRLYEASVTLLAKALRSGLLARRTPGATSPAAPPFQFYDRPLYRIPSNEWMARRLTRWGARRATESLAARTFQEQWVLLVHPTQTRASTGYQFRALHPPSPELFWADPFAIERGGGRWIFFEEFDARQGRGRIAYLRIGARAEVLEHGVALERPYHLSFPGLFEHDGALFMLPETGAAGELQLFRCEQFPARWGLVRAWPFAPALVDPVLFEHEGRTWLLASPRGSTNELLLFFKDGPLLDGAWTPHPLNPVVTDVRWARPAGQPFRDGDSWVRPAQNCSHRYGHGIQFRRIVRLSPEAYEEQPVTGISPSFQPGLLGVHTYNFAPSFTVMDGLRRLPLLAR